MFDTMTLTKLMGGLCGTFLVYLLGGWAAETIYHSGGGGHGDHHEAAYVIHPVEDDAPVVVEEGPAFADMMASAVADDGSNVFRRQCSACHQLADGENGTGPHLYGIVGRATASVDGFGYSGSLVAVVAEWSPEALDAFIENPREYAPGTAMGYNGLSDGEDWADLITYLSTFAD